MLTQRLHNEMHRDQILIAKDEVLLLNPYCNNEKCK